MAHSNKDKPPAGRFSYEGLDRVIHERARLSILTSLIANKRGLLFGDLKQLCALSDGNLSRHLQVLQEAKLIAVSKGLRKIDPRRSAGSPRWDARATSNMSRSSSRWCATRRRG